MKFAMIGAGALSRAIAGHVVKAGHDVVFSNSAACTCFAASWTPSVAVPRPTP